MMERAIWVLRSASLNEKRRPDPIFVEPVWREALAVGRPKNEDLTPFLGGCGWGSAWRRVSSLCTSVWIALVGLAASFGCAAAGGDALDTLSKGAAVPAGDGLRLDDAEESRLRERADRLLDQVVESDGGSGAMAAVMVDGNLVWSGVTGYADVENQVPMRTDHKLRVGSVSKSLTAVLVLRLAELGKLELDAPIGSHLPELPDELRNLTIGQLASHTAGVRHYDFANYLEANNVMYHESLRQAVEFFLDDPLIAPPGTQFHYTSLGYNLIGATIESATGGSYGDVFHEYVGNPLGLTATLPNDPLELISDRADFYTVTAENPMMSWMRDGELINTIFRDDSDLYPSGGMLSNAEDLVRFLDEVFSSGFLSPESSKRLSSPALLGGGEPVRWNERGREGFYSLGFGLFPGGSETIDYMGHGGETNGAYALIRYYREQRIAVAAVTNYNTVTGETAFFELMGDEIARLFGVGN